MENDYRAEGSANGAGRDGGNRNYGRYNNDGERRARRPRIGGNYEGGERPYRSSSYNRYNANGERPQRPRFNPNREGGYSSEPCRQACATLPPLLFRILS